MSDFMGCAFRAAPLRAMVFPSQKAWHELCLYVCCNTVQKIGDFALHAAALRLQ
jgi:hypothetical protein